MDRPATDVVRGRRPSLIFWVSDLLTTFVPTVRSEMRPLREDEYVWGAVKEARQSWNRVWIWRREESEVSMCENSLSIVYFLEKCPRNSWPHRESRRL